MIQGAKQTRQARPLKQLYLWVVGINQLEGIGETLEDASLFHDTEHLASQTRRRCAICGAGVGDASRQQ